MRTFSRFTNLYRLSVIVFITSLLMLSLLTLPAYASSKILGIQLSPDNGPPGTVVTVTGTGFGIQEPIVITFDGQQIGSGTSDTQGNFSIQFTVPRNAQPGFHVVEAVGQNSGRSARATFLLQYQWQIVHNPGTGSLQGIVTISANNVWAVGYSPTGTLTEQWNGTSWNVISSPGSGQLNGVAAVSANDVWAVGATGSGTLIEQWNGASWSVIPSPSPDTTSYLSSVAVVSANDIWAVGASSTGTLIEQWNGTTWDVVPSPSPDTSSVLSGVAAVSASDVWAVGYTSSATLTENWNGSTWNVVSSPNSGSLSSVVVISASDIWAVGTSYGVSKSKTLTEHWNGTSWAVIPSPNVQSSSFGDELYSVTAVSSKNVWAVGLNWTHDDFYDSVIENWNGSKWKIVSNPPRPYYSFSDLSGIASVPGTSHLWAVGYYSTGQKDHVVTEYYG